MNSNMLGQTGINVSKVSFGTVSLGVPYGINVDSQKDMLSELQAIDLLRMAVDRGVRFFDTARDYGCSEERLGKAFKGRRQDAVIATKCTPLYGKDRILPPDHALEKLIDGSLNRSLSALQTDYVDVYMLHNADLGILQNQTIANTFLGYKQKGLVRAIGVSTYTVEETLDAIKSGIWDVIQLPYNLMDQRQNVCFDLAAEKGIGLVVRSVLFKGILTDRCTNLHPALEAVEQHRQHYCELLDENISTLSELATRFVLSHPQVSSVLVGIDKEEYLDQAISVADSHCLDQAIRQKLRELAFPNPEFLDLPKWNQMGWLT
ncbi:aldo/keto reductase [bacterium AH-315-I18]|nr:aldo/keto reductase [bacterium AH-315-I18]